MEEASYGTQPGDGEDGQPIQQFVSHQGPDGEEYASSSDEEDVRPTLLERRALNVKRNDDYESRLGLEHGIFKNIKTKASKKKEEQKEDEKDCTVQQKRGMLLALPTEIPGTFPYREKQMRKLKALLSTGTSTPIMISGPSGSGKSAVVTESIRENGSRRKFLHAYVDCATLDAPSIDEVTRSAFHQFEDQQTPGQIAMRRNRKRRRESFVAKPLDKKKKHKKKPIARKEIRKRPSRHKATFNEETKNEKSSDVDLQRSAESMMTCVWNFGCMLEALLEKDQACVLVLDHAERLVSFDANKKESMNFLSQLLLLPRVLSLNLTFVVVSQSILLGHTRLHIPPSQGSLAGCIHPIQIHFPAYEGKSMIKQILAQPRNQVLIFGDEINIHTEGFKPSLRKSFLGTLVQSLHDRTLDLKEYIRKGRELWKTYIEPLQSDRIGKTLETAKKTACIEDRSAIQSELLALLDRRFLPQLRRDLEKETQLSDDIHEFPNLQKYLLLSAFLCQVNRPDRDRKLFSIQKNGKRRRNAPAAGNGDEEGAFGAAAKRTRTYPAERMLSVFVSVVGLNSGGSDDERMRSLGSTSFFESLAELRQIGLIHGNSRRCWCSLTAAEAQSIAKSLNFPLDKYML